MCEAWGPSLAPQTEKTKVALFAWKQMQLLWSGACLTLKGLKLLSFPAGKTAAFALPVLERLIYKPRQAPVTRVLVLVPTRELGIQVHSVTKQLAQFCNITTCLAVGECPASAGGPCRTDVEGIWACVREC